MDGKSIEGVCITPLIDPPAQSKHQIPQRRAQRIEPQIVNIRPPVQRQLAEFNRQRSEKTRACRFEERGPLPQQRRKKSNRQKHADIAKEIDDKIARARGEAAVSYTHLTLPTN